MSEFVSNSIAWLAGRDLEKHSTRTFIWATPLIVLANRVHPDDKGNATRLRREVANAVARAVGVGEK